MDARADDNIGQIVDEREIRRLIALLEDDDEDVRANVAEVLAKIGKPAVLPLIDALKDEKIWYAAVDVLVKLGELAIPSLITALRDEYIANFAIHALFGIGEPAVLPLIDALKDEDSGVRSWVAVVFNSTRDKRIVEPLIDALKDEDKLVRQLAAQALGRSGDEQSIPALRWLQQHDSNTQVQDAATEAIVRIEGQSQKTT